MMTSRLDGWRLIVVLLALCGASSALGQGEPQSMPLVPARFVLDAAASKAIDAPWLTEAERAQLRVFHGVWDERDLATPELRAQAALNAWNFDDPALSDEQVSAESRAEARLRSGELDLALALLENARSNRAIRIRAEALETMGRPNEAGEAVNELVERLLRSKVNDPAELTEGVKAMVIRARIQGQPGRDFQHMMDLLARCHQELDRLYWPAKLAEAELLLDKDNPREALMALHETLSLNPRCAEAWNRLGQIALDRFDFGSAAAAAAALRRLNPQHPLADLIDAESRLVQDDPDGALEILEPLTERLPQLRPAYAFIAAARAIQYDDGALKAALAKCDELSPGSAQAHAVVGRQLSFNRQYETAAEILEEAIRRQPSWPAPQIDLGLMELQSGRDDRALRALQNVVKLDPFNKRAANSLFLLEELATYQEIESEHFIVRYKPGPDQVMAEMMPEPLERLHAIVSTRFNWSPPQKTLIEVHPDHQRFAVRITGMPFVHTIAACTGPVIAMEVPREGAPNIHQGLFDWPRVLQHEYTHTITLGQTRNRIPHWLTEAAAVSMEPGPRTYETCLMLAESYENGTLFDLDEIKWAFVRPKRPNDRGKAYAQGFWMVQYMNERFGESALVRLLERYFHGEREQQAIPNALGVSRAQFFNDFLVWAGEQVKSWGLAAQPSMTDLTDELRAQDEKLAAAMEAARQIRLDILAQRLIDQIGEPSEMQDGREGLTAERWPPLVRPPVNITDERLATWLGAHPNHPDLLELHIRRRISRLENELPQADDEALIALLHQYLQARPVDVYPHRQLSRIWLISATPERAIEHLEELDVREEKTPAYALQLAKLYRAAQQPEKALAKITRAVHMNPYNAPNRELAAAIAIEAADYDAARQHVVALTILEPDRPQHAKRLAALDKLIGERAKHR